MATGSLLTQSQQNILGVGAKYDASNADEDIVTTQERKINSPDGKEVTCKLDSVTIDLFLSSLFKEKSWKVRNFH